LQTIKQDIHIGQRARGVSVTTFKLRDKTKTDDKDAADAAVTPALQASGLDWHTVGRKWVGLKQRCGAIARAVGFASSNTEAVTEADITANSEGKMKEVLADGR